MCMKCSQTERPPTVTQIKLDKKNRDFSEFMKINNLEISLFATFCGFFTNVIFIFLLLIACSVLSVCSVCWLNYIDISL